jgi:three-Cys-motif partner protein
MPVLNCVGFSDSTSVKQNDFEIIIKTHIKAACLGIIGKADNSWAGNSYLYFDMNAGPGFYNGISGSPIIFLNEAAKYDRTLFDVFLFESNELNFQQLKENIANCHYPKNINIRILNTDSSSDILKHVPSKGFPKYGLIYSDPTGQVPPFETLAKISNITQCKKIDIVVNFAATTIKRIRGSHVCSESQTLKDYLSKINKQHWMVREPNSRHQWSFVIGSNWKDFPAFKKQDFHGIESKRGSSIFDFINYSKKEKTVERIKQCKQLSLSF